MSRQLSIQSNVSMNSSIQGSIVSDKGNREGMELESSSKGKFKGSAWINYYISAAHWSVLAIIFTLFLIAQFMASAADVWVSVW